METCKCMPILFVCFILLMCILSMQMFDTLAWKSMIYVSILGYFKAIFMLVIKCISVIDIYLCIYNVKLCMLTYITFYVVFFAVARIMQY